MLPLQLTPHSSNSHHAPPNSHYTLPQLTPHSPPAHSASHTPASFIPASERAAELQAPLPVAPRLHDAAEAVSSLREPAPLVTWQTLSSPSPWTRLVSLTRVPRARAATTSNTLSPRWTQTSPRLCHNSGLRLFFSISKLLIERPQAGTNRSTLRGPASV